MTRWTGIVLALPAAGGDEMASRLPTHLHPVAGRPLIWHAVSAVGRVEPAPERVLVIGGADLPLELFHDLPGEVQVLPPLDDGDLSQLENEIPLDGSEHVLVLSANAAVGPEALRALLGWPSACWLAGANGAAVAAWLPAAQLPELFRLPEPLLPPNGVLGESQRVAAAEPGLLIQNRAQLALASRAIRDRLVQELMRAGVTFLLPDSVLVDVDVRIGRDSVIYPGVVLEGQTTIGEETVLGPGCRVISSWIGSGVEMKGWNYIAHTSIRNRAILEPYVRRGFD